MSLVIWIINREQTRKCKITDQRQLDLLVPIINSRLESGIGNSPKRIGRATQRKTMNDELLDVLDAAGLAPDFNGPDSDLYFPLKGKPINKTI